MTPKFVYTLRAVEETFTGRHYGLRSSFNCPPPSHSGVGLIRCPKGSSCQHLHMASRRSSYRREQDKAFPGAEISTRALAVAVDAVSPAAGVSPLSPSSIHVSIEVLGGNSRRVSASVAVPAAAETLWQTLTDYDQLGTFIPSLAVNQVLRRRINGARILQVGEQDVALGLTFRARVIVDVTEGPEGRRAEVQAQPPSSDGNHTSRNGQATTDKPQASVPPDQPQALEDAQPNRVEGGAVRTSVEGHSSNGGSLSRGSPPAVAGEGVGGVAPAQPPGTDSAQGGESAREEGTGGQSERGRDYPACLTPCPTDPSIVFVRGASSVAEEEARREEKAVDPTPTPGNATQPNQGTSLPQAVSQEGEGQGAGKRGHGGEGSSSSESGAGMSLASGHVKGQAALQTAAASAGSSGEHAAETGDQQGAAQLSGGQLEELAAPGMDKEQRAGGAGERPFGEGARRQVFFSMVEGDFQKFEGVWTIERDVEGQGPASLLSYSVDVTPQFWLPVALVEGRISSDIRNNLASVGQEAVKRQEEIGG